MGGERTEWKGSTSLIRNFCFSPQLLSQGMLALVLTCIDRLNIYNSVAHFAGIAREESGMAWKEILNLLYKLLGKCTHSPLPGRFPRVVSMKFPLDKPRLSFDFIPWKPFINHLILTQPFIPLTSSLLYFLNLEQEVNSK